MSKSTDYKAIAEEMANQLSMALTKLRHTSDWMGMLKCNETGELYSWEESFARSIEKLPNIDVDRRYIEAKHLPAKQRRQRFWELNQETPEQRLAAIKLQKKDTHHE